jgi:hypothetical protein
MVMQAGTELSGGLGALLTVGLVFSFRGLCDELF